MQDFTQSLDPLICEQVQSNLGLTPTGLLYKYIMENFPNIKVLDRQAFTKGRGYEPCIGSIFVITNGGSAEFKYRGRDLVTSNGTLLRYSDGLPWWKISLEYEKIMAATKYLSSIIN